MQFEITPQLIHVLIHIFTLVGVVLCFIYCRGAYRTSPRTAINELLGVMEKFEAHLDQNDGKWKKLNANYALLLAREKSNGSAPDETADSDTGMKSGETPDQWKTRMRKKLAAGGLKHE